MLKYLNDALNARYSPRVDTVTLAVSFGINIIIIIIIIHV